MVSNAEVAAAQNDQNGKVGGFLVKIIKGFFKI
jgi:hypothetical protein